jgi:D-beta-D-heptose 7-phosphate kinase/D-beta-D-heptose 1-phosphate adenosyltransferase
MLEESASMGDLLFVAINSDASVRRLKGNQRPVINEQARARSLAALECVDHVLVFDDATAHRMLSAIRPDILVKGGTTTEIVGREVVESYGGRIERTAEIPGMSTTALLSQLNRQSGCASDGNGPSPDRQGVGPIAEPVADARGSETR